MSPLCAHGLIMKVHVYTCTVAVAYFLFDCCDQLPLESAYNLFADTTEHHPFDITTHATFH